MKKDLIILTGLLFGAAAGIILFLTFLLALLQGGRVTVTLNTFGEMYYEIPFVILYLVAPVLAVLCFLTKRPLVPCFYCGKYISPDNVFYNSDQDENIFICRDCITRLR